MNRQIDFESLRMENFQLKNQITDLKNGFDLNKEVLKILQEHSKQSNPKSFIFYQIISRLTGVNNQIMLANIELVQQKNKLSSENRKMQVTIQNLSTKLQELIHSRDCTNPKQINLQQNQIMKELRLQIFSLNQNCFRKQIQIERLQSVIKQKEKQELKKPIIPSVTNNKSKDNKLKEDSAQIKAIPKLYETKGKITHQVVIKNLQRQNTHLKRLVQELEYRLTVFANLYNLQPLEGRERQLQMQRNQQSKFKKITQDQLSLLMFALNNTQLAEDPEGDEVKVTITKRCKIFNKEERRIQRTSSSFF